MPLTSPLADPPSWTLRVIDRVIPDGLRYGGTRVRAIRAETTDGAPRDVVAPAPAALKKVATDAGEAVELEFLPFRIAAVARRLKAGLPTLILEFDAPDTVTFDENDVAAKGDVLASVTGVTLSFATQDRMLRDPALVASELAQAITDSAGDGADWQPFVDRLDDQVNGGTGAPVMILDHAGLPVSGRTVEVRDGGGTVRDVPLLPADNGDLQRARVRLGLPPLWAAGNAATLRPLDGGDYQLALLEDGNTAAGQIDITPATRHVLMTDMHDWFAAQFAVAAPPPELARFTRGNRLTPLINGPAFFDDLFRELQAARNDDGLFYLAGWGISPLDEVAESPAGAPGDFAVTLKQAAERIGAAQGATRFLPAEFITIDDLDDAESAEIVLFFFLVAFLMAMKGFGVEALMTDGTGLIILFAIYMAAPFVLEHFLGDDGYNAEPNKPAIEELDSVDNAQAHLARYPATVDDNPLADPNDFPLDVLFPVIRHFGVFHQKFAILRTADDRYIGYCGGIDVDSNRLDDENHLNPSPYHDLHTRIEGPAVRDLAITFEQRWDNEADGSALPAGAPAAGLLGTPGDMAAQFARTYFLAENAARALPYAPVGDRTLLDSVLNGIQQAKEFIYIEDQYLTPSTEYNDALVQKVENGDIKLLVIAIPAVTDQPFGAGPRSDLISRLRAAANPNGTVLKIGSPRRRYTVAQNDLRAGSGKLILMHDTSDGGGDSGLAKVISLGPPHRVPRPPFWLSVEGELMYVSDEPPFQPNPDPDNSVLLTVERGAATRIVSGQELGKGATQRAHAAGAAATVVSLDNIYVHAKMMIVDDVFLSVGSANLNRRGFYHDGEANIFSLPESLKTDPANPILDLRKRLWAEMLDLPYEIGEPLLADPIGAAALFDRSYFFGNRFVEPEAVPANPMFQVTGGDGLVSTVLQILGIVVAATQVDEIFDAISDPTSRLEPGI